MSSLSDMIKTTKPEVSPGLSVTKKEEGAKDSSESKTFYVTSHPYTFKLNGKTFAPDVQGRYVVSGKDIEGFEFYLSQGYISDQAPAHQEQTEE